MNGSSKPSGSIPPLQKAETERKTDRKTPRIPYFGTKTVERMSAPASSKSSEAVTTIRTSRVIFSRPVPLTDSCARMRDRSPRRRPIMTLKKVVKVTRPSPPICSSSMMTSCPAVDQWVPVSTVTRPVTQLAEVAVKSASRKVVCFPGAVQAGSRSSRVPSAITMAKLTAIIRAGLIARASRGTGSFSRFKSAYLPSVRYSHAKFSRLRSFLKVTASTAWLHSTQCSSLISSSCRTIFASAGASPRK